MGKYMRKCRREDAAVGGVEVTQAVGVRTRSRAAAVADVVVSKRRRPLPPSSPASSSLAARGQSGSCYLKLRSRTLFMAPPAPASAAVVGHGHGPAPLPAGLSRCSSTASSVDASAAPQDRSLPSSCGSDAAAKAGAPEGSASNNSESGGNRERRETTPSSQFPGDLSDLESDLAGHNSGRSSLPQTPAAEVQAAAARARTPAAAEIEEFFAAAEQAEARRFACKYNFDVTRGVPLDSGRFEWSPAVSSN